MRRQERPAEEYPSPGMASLYFRREQTARQGSLRLCASRRKARPHKETENGFIFLSETRNGVVERAPSTKETMPEITFQLSAARRLRLGSMLLVPILVTRHFPSNACRMISVKRSLLADKTVSCIFLLPDSTLPALPGQRQPSRVELRTLALAAQQPEFSCRELDALISNLV